MKLKKIYLCLLFILITIPAFVKAANVSVSLSCPTVVTVNSEIDCKVNVTSDVLINGLASKYILSGVSYVSFTPQNGFTTNYASASGFAVGNTSGKSGTFTIGNIKLKVNSAGSIQLSNLDASDTNFNSYGAGASTNTISFRLASENNSLSNLALSNGTLSPKFSKDTTSYNATVDSSSVTINATKGDNYQTVTGAGTHSLNYGNNIFKVVVTSESGSSKTYTITVDRPDNRSKNNNLKSLSLSNGNISFNKSITNYSLNVESDVTSVKIDATLDDNNSSFVDGYGPRTVNLNYGDNFIEIRVKAQNDSVKTYAIKINRKDNRSKNNNLKNLSLSEGKIIFNKDTLEYNISVNYDVTKIKVDVVAEDDKSVVRVDNKDLVIGDNTITVEVINERGEIKTYKINVKRLSEEEKMSDNNNISKLTILGHELKFSNEVFNYNIELFKEEKELLFEVELEDGKANYALEGNKNLKKGSVITLTTISESGIKKEYKFTVSKVKGGNIILYIIVSIIFLIIGFVLGFICSKFTNKKNNNQNKEEKSVITNTVVSEPMMHESQKISEPIMHESQKISEPINNNLLQNNSIMNQNMFDMNQFNNKE